MGNPLWLPLWTHFEALCAIEFLNEMQRPLFAIRDLRLLLAVKRNAKAVICYSRFEIVAGR